MKEKVGSLVAGILMGTCVLVISLLLPSQYARALGVFFGFVFVYHGVRMYRKGE